MEILGSMALPIHVQTAIPSATANLVSTGRRTVSGVIPLNSAENGEVLLVVKYQKPVPAMSTILAPNVSQILDASGVEPIPPA